MKTCLHRDWYLNLHSSFFHNNPKLEVAQMSTKGWVGKQIVVYSRNGTLPSGQKEQVVEKYNHTEEPERGRTQKALWFHAQKSLKKAKIIITEIRSVVVWGCREEAWRGGQTTKRQEGTFLRRWQRPECYCSDNYTKLSELIKLYT